MSFRRSTEANVKFAVEDLGVLMCGILAFVQAGEGSSTANLGATAELLAHRGPDDFGIYTAQVVDSWVGLAHTRLSIIDLSEKGHQPMLRDGLSISFNGEIYNYVELRDELEAAGEKFDTASDTEVILASWRHWGEACIGKFEGMFSFMLLDEKSGMLYAVRDGYGIKPLYFGTSNGVCVFASEPKVVIAGGNFHFDVDDTAGLDFYLHGWTDRSDRTFYKGVRQVLPGHLISIDLASKTFTQKMWLDLQIGVPPEEVRSSVRTALEESVAKQQRSDAPIAFAVSGGIDSSILVAIADRQVGHAGPLRTFGYVSCDVNRSEEHWQSIASDFWQTAHLTVRDFPEDPSTRVKKLLDVIGEPFSSSSVFAQFRLFNAVGMAGIKVSIDGQGADELYAGYLGYRPEKLIDAIRTLNPPAIRELIRDSKSQGELWKDLIAILFRTLVPFSVNSKSARLIHLLRRLPRFFSSVRPIRAVKVASTVLQSFDPRTQFAGHPGALQLKLAEDIWVTHLPQLLKNGDRNSMANSVESRVPYLNDQSVFIALAIAGTSRSLKAGSKTELKASFADLLPERIYARQDKIGFSGDELEWSSIDSELFEQALRGLTKYSWFRLRKIQEPRTFFFSLDSATRFRALTLGLWASSGERLGERS